MQLLIQQPDGRPQKVALNPSGTVRLGSRAPAEIVLAGEGIHPVHCGIVGKGGQFQVVASKAAGKVKLNGAPVTAAAVKAGDRIEIGPVMATFVGAPGGTPAVAAGDDFGLKPIQSPKPAPGLAPLADDFGLKPIGKPAPKPTDLPELTPLDELTPIEPLTERTPLEPLAELTPLGPTASLPELSDADLIPAEGGAAAAPAPKPTPRTVRRPAPAAPPPKRQPSPTPAPTPTQEKRAEPSPQPPHRHRRAPLVIAAGAVVLVLAGGATGAYFLFFGTSSEELFLTADAKYQAKQYADAEKSFETYLAAAPQGAHAEEAKLKQGLARVLPQVESSAWPQALAAVRDATGQWGDAAYADAAQRGLAESLPQILAGLAKQAQDAGADDEKLSSAVTQASGALELIDRYLPADEQERHQIGELRGQIALLQRQVKQAQALRTAVSAIDAAAREGKAAEVAAAREDLLLAYPKLARSPALISAMQRTATALKDRVSAAEKQTAAQPGGGDEAFALAAVFSTSSAGGGAAAAPGDVAVIFAPEHGAVYGLDSASGRLWWRRAVGLDSVAPVLALDDDGRAAGAVLFDSRHGELLRVAGSDGKALWRQKVGPLAGEPVVHGRQVFAATRDGSLLVIDADSGSLLWQYGLPLPPACAPAVDLETGTICVLAEHSFLFVISGREHKCMAAVYVGHDAGTVATPPVIVGKHLLVFEDDGLEETLVRIVALDGTPAALQPVNLPGRVRQPPRPMGNRLLVATEQGQLHVLDHLESERARPIRRGASGALDESAAAGVAGPQLFLLGQDLGAAWRQGVSIVQRTTDGRLTSKARMWEGQSCALGASSSASIVIARRSPDRDGIAVAALDPRNAQTVRWETTLAEPLAAAAVSAAEFRAVTPAEELFRGGLPGGTSTAPTVFEASAGHQARRASGFQPGRAFSLPSATVLAPLGGPSLVFDTGLDKPRTLHSFSAAITCCEKIDDGHLLVGLSGGPVFVYDVEKRSPGSRPVVLPGAGESPWLAGVADEKTFVAACGSTLCRLEFDGASRKLAAARTAPLGGTAIRGGGAGGLAVVGQFAWLVRKKEGPAATYDVVSFRLPGLEEATAAPLSAAPVFGPETLGNRAIVATADGVVRCIAGDNVAWTSGPRFGRVVGAAALDSERWIVASRSGTLFIVTAATGDVSGTIDAGQPLAGGMWIAGDRLALSASDGSLLVSRETTQKLSSAPAAAAAGSLKTR
ncbi:MAG: PQQ-binding-like beta-propeller repeat protein [Planctomycetia bacterium]|nr:PQQ-binding-like beta-propeller repeat protein [Planctomycetia bacterium]